MSADQTLVLAAHGSQHDAKAAAPVHAHADRLRERGGFDTVRAAFWKEQPSLASVLATIEARTAYVVPLMMSRGYFTERVFPRELGLGEGSTAGQTVRYAEPVGTHQRLADVIVDRVDAVLEGRVGDGDVGVAIVGHGTERHPGSASASLDHAARLRVTSRYAAVEALFLDQSPSVADLTDRFDVEDVAIVPLFVAAGGHVGSDVPAAIGLPNQDPFGGPTSVDGHRLWYAEPVGTAPSLIAVILERAAEVGADTRAGRAAPETELARSERAFLERLVRVESTSGVRPWGELAITITADDGRRRFAIRHADDIDVPRAGLDRLVDSAAVRARTGFDDAGNHRPLRTARTLPTGWRFETNIPSELVMSVRAVYPASIDHWYRDRGGSLEATHFEAVVGRQAGQYSDLDAVDQATLDASIAACCGDCIRRRDWPARRTEPAASTDTVPCPEPCSFLLEAMRSFARADEPTAASEAVDPSVPAAAFDRPGNRTRVRFRRAFRERVLPDPEAITNP